MTLSTQDGPTVLITGGSSGLGAAVVGVALGVSLGVGLAALRCRDRSARSDTVRELLPPSAEAVGLS